MDGVVETATIRASAGPPEESMKVAGVWEVQGDTPFKRLELQRKGGLVRRVLLEDNYLHRRYGNWRIVSPGRVLFYRHRFSKNTDLAAVYAYRIVGDEMTLTWIDERADTGWPNQAASWEPWVGGELGPTFRLKRVADQAFPRGPKNP
jgi:hypothetical protein